MTLDKPKTEYMAELIGYKLPPLPERIMEFNKMKLELAFHMSIFPNQLSDYFKNISNEICEIIKVKCDDEHKISNNPVIHSNVKGSLGYNHKHVDANRNTAIAIPITNIKCPLNFYSSNDPEDTELVYTGYYSKEHPTCTHVSILHNITENERGRIIFQLSFQMQFEELISKNPDVWKFIPNIHTDDNISKLS